MSIEELKYLINDKPSHFSIILKRKHPQLYNTIDGMFNYKSFSQKLYDYVYSPNNKCVVCGKISRYNGITNGYSDVCCNKCKGKLKHLQSVEIRKCVICNTEFEIYKKRKKTTCSDKCLKELNKSKSVNEKRLASYNNTMRKKYGVDWYSETDMFKNKMHEYHITGKYDYIDILNKSKKTKLEKYGDENYNNLNKLKNTLIEKYGVDNFSKTIDFKKAHFKNVIGRLDNSIKYVGTYDNYNGVSGYKYKFKCLNCNNIFVSTLNNGAIPVCRKCHPISSGISKFEKEIVEFIKSISNLTIVENDRTILKPMELDIYVPEKKIAIECNGNYWHSELNGSKDKHYHLTKTNECNDAGIRLIHIFEDEWNYKTDIVKSRLKHILGISENKLYARQTIVKEIDSKLKKDFLEKTHIQGNDKSIVKLGLFHKTELVAVMTFSKRKIFKNTEWELVRFSTKYSVIGAATKLFKYFVKNYNPDKIITYSDIRWNVGNVYEKMGFDKVKQTHPGYFYLQNGQRINRINFQKHKLKDKLESFDETLTEWQNMQLNGYDRIWDCGHYKYEWSI